MVSKISKLRKKEKKSLLLPFDCWLLVLYSLIDTLSLLVLFFPTIQCLVLELLYGCLPLYKLLQNKDTSLPLACKNTSFLTHCQLPAEHGYPTGNANIFLKQHFYHFQLPTIKPTIFSVF